MKIAIDVREALVEKPAGKGMLVRFLVEALLKEKPSFKLVLLCGENQKAPAHWPVRKIKAAGFWWHLYLILILPFSDIDLFVSPLSAIVPALLIGQPSLPLVMDLSAWRYPKEQKLKTILLDKLFLPLAVKRAQKVIVISRFTKDELEKILKVKSSKIAVMPLGPTLAGEEKIKLPYEKYLLYLGTLEPRKNLERLIEAYQLAGKIIQLPPLLLAGRLGWKSASITELMKKTSGIDYLGYVSESQKRMLIKNALGFLYPSLYEGFGLPPLEALFLGVPTLVSQAASLPEVCGQAAVYVNPVDVESIKQGIIDLMKPVVQARLRRLGPEQAEKFSWERAAKILINTINEIIRL